MSLNLFSFLFSALLVLAFLFLAASLSVGIKSIIFIIKASATEEVLFNGLIPVVMGYSIKHIDCFECTPEVIPELSIFTRLVRGSHTQSIFVL